jgi:hypothetical protein
MILAVGGSLQLRRWLTALLFGVVVLFAGPPVSDAWAEAEPTVSSVRVVSDDCCSTTTYPDNARADAMRGKRRRGSGPRSPASATSLSVATKGGLKRGPKPFGTGPHNLRIGEVADSVTDGRIIAGGQTGLPERFIPTPNGLLSGRRADVLVERADGSLYGINVGRVSSRTGAPIKREAEALNDLEGAGIEMHFVPYR